MVRLLGNGATTDLLATQGRIEEHKRIIGSRRRDELENGGRESLEQDSL
jgi:hypothetical protein